MNHHRCASQPAMKILSHPWLFTSQPFKSVIMVHPTWWPSRPCKAWSRSWITFLSTVFPLSLLCSLFIMVVTPCLLTRDDQHDGACRTSRSWKTQLGCDRRNHSCASLWSMTPFVLTRDRRFSSITKIHPPSSNSHSSSIFFLFLSINSLHHQYHNLFLYQLPSSTLTSSP